MLKTLHIATVYFSLLLFLGRLGWSFTHSWSSRPRWMKIVPHVNDTLLLIAALLMLWDRAMNPFEFPWVMAKILALVVYVMLGTLTFRASHTKPQRIIFAALSLLVFAYIVGVAKTKSVEAFFLL